jgi:hypothetical protein
VNRCREESSYPDRIGFAFPSYAHVEADYGRQQARLRSHRRSSNLGPGGGSLVASGMKFCGGVLPGTARKSVGDEAMAMLRKGQVRNISGNDIRAQANIHRQIFSSRRLRGELGPLADHQRPNAKRCNKT